MSENRRQILQMLSEGKVNADEAERLISASEGASSLSSEPGSPSAGKSRPKYLRVQVDSEDDGGREGPTKVNVRVPMQLLRAGVRLAGLIPPQAREHVTRAMRERGIPFDLSQVKPDNLQELLDHFNDLTIDVDVDNRGGFGQEKVKVRVFCE